MTAEQFADRHIGPDPGDERRMLETVGFGSIDELMDAAIPEVIRWHGTLDLPARRRAGGDRRAAGPGRPEHRRCVDDRPGLLRHAHPGGDPP